MFAAWCLFLAYGNTVGHVCCYMGDLSKLCCKRVTHSWYEGKNYDNFTSTTDPAYEVLPHITATKSCNFCI